VSAADRGVASMAGKYSHLELKYRISILSIRLVVFIY
jgi:hypothetical protein